MITISPAYKLGSQLFGNIIAIRLKTPKINIPPTITNNTPMATSTQRMSFPYLRRMIVTQVIPKAANRKGIASPAE